jgi:hypothetical protein
MKNLLLAGVAVVAGFGIFGGALSAYAAVPSVVSVKLTGANILTVIYSEPVTTNTWDYTNFTGNLSGLGVVSISGSGSSVITLNLSGTPVVSTGSSGYLTIGAGVKSVSTSSAFPGGSYNVTSAQAPVLSSVSVAVNNIGSTFSTVGSQITLTFSVNESVVNPTVTILGHTIGVNGTGLGPYTVIYTPVTGDAQGTVNATIMFTDMNGNSGSATVNVLSNGAGSNGNSSGYITSNANSPGILYSGNSITFTLVPSTPQPNARSVVGSYNGVPISWYTTNNGATYTGIYTVSAGQSNTTYPLQISAVSFIDQYGNTLGPFSGSDVQKTITATAATGPVTVYQTAAVTTPTTNQTPSYGFVSTVAGTIRYGGDCSSPTTSATAGQNTVVFNALASGTHSNCTITVTDAAGNVSNQLVVSPFTTGAAVTTPAPVPAATSTSDADLTSQLTSLQNQLATLKAAQTGQTDGTPSASVSSSYKFSTLLKSGSNGTAVLELQKRLIQEGFLKAAANGHFGPATEAALKKYQTAHGLRAVGQLGPSTRVILNKQ